MAGKLDKDKVRQWIRGQEAAQRLIARERVQRLLAITPEESWRIYLELKEAAPARPSSEISHVLLAMRQMLKKYTEAKRGRD